MGTFVSEGLFVVNISRPGVTHVTLTVYHRILGFLIRDGEALDD